MSIWADVTHDPAAAQEAIEALHQVASHLEGLTASRHDLARQAFVDWHGARRDEVQGVLDLLLAHSEDLVARLRRTADRIAEETELATAEQRRRERLRALWSPELQDQ